MRPPVDLAEAFGDKSAANLDTDPLEKIRAAGANLGSFDTGDITIGYFRGTSPWEPTLPECSAEFAANGRVCDAQHFRSLQKLIQRGRPRTT